MASGSALGHEFEQAPGASDDGQGGLSVPVHGITRSWTQVTEVSETLLMPQGGSSTAPSALDMALPRITCQALASSPQTCGFLPAMRKTRSPFLLYIHQIHGAQSQDLPAKWAGPTTLQPQPLSFGAWRHKILLLLLIQQAHRLRRAGYKLGKHRLVFAIRPPAVDPLMGCNAGLFCMGMLHSRLSVPIVLRQKGCSGQPLPLRDH